MRQKVEYGTGYKLLKTLQETNQNNIAGFVIRHYGGQHLGPDRHRIMKKSPSRSYPSSQVKMTLPVGTELSRLN